MELILILLTSCIMSALFGAFFMLGVYVGHKQKQGVKASDLTQENVKFLEDLGKWVGFNG